MTQYTIKQHVEQMNKFFLSPKFNTQKSAILTLVYWRYFNTHIPTVLILEKGAILTPLQKGVKQFVFYIDTWQIFVFVLFQITIAKRCWNNTFAYLHHLVLI